jgi:hypothetical protein
MLRRLTLGLFTLACAAAVAACSSYGSNSVPSSGGVPGIGPNFKTNTIYVSDTTQNVIYIYTPSPGPSATPQYQIGGGNTGLNGPGYLAFDSSKRLYVGNFNPATTGAAIMIYQTFATGNVLPLGQLQVSNGAQPHGIAMKPDNTGFAIAYTWPGGVFPNLVNVYTAFTSGTSTVQLPISGSNTKLNNPIGVGFDQNNNLYVANSGSGQLTEYVLPTPSPTPSGSPTPTPAPTATPTPAPSGAPTPTPSPTPTPFSVNLAPIATVNCVPGAGMPSPCMVHPAGLTLDGSGNVYVTDPDSGVAPGIYIFSAAQVACAAPPCTLNVTPSRFISGSNTKLVNPTDVKVDSSGTIYVVDGGSGPNTSMLLIFGPNASGNVAPNTAIALPAGTATGMALSP